MKRCLLILMISLLPLAAPSKLLAQQKGAPHAARSDLIDQILTRLQQRSDGLKDIRCRVRYVEEDRVNLARRTKVGSILFLMADPNPYFLIHFEKSEMDGILGKQEWYLFDGRWLYEGLERLRQVTQSEIAPPGKQVDLFNLETAPFPMPFGQKKETILRHFNVTLLAPGEGDPPDTDHLVCVPKPKSRLYRKYDRLEFFIRKDIHLPSRVIVTKNDGLEIITADFPDLSAESINAGVRKRDFAKPSAWRKYQVVVEETAPEN